MKTCFSDNVHSEKIFIKLKNRTFLAPQKFFFTFGSILSLRQVYLLKSTENRDVLIPMGPILTIVKWKLTGVKSGIHRYAFLEAVITKNIIKICLSPILWEAKTLQGHLPLCSIASWCLPKTVSGVRNFRF